MDLNKQKIQLWEYLDKTYYIKVGKFLTRYESIHEFGSSIAKSMARIFSFDEELCKQVLTYWAYSHDMSEKQFDDAYYPKLLKTSWNPEMSNDLIAYGINYPEQQIIDLLAQQLSDEIDAQILKDLKHELQTIDEFLSVVKCMGYAPTSAVYDPITFMPRKHFMALNYNEVLNERQNNTYWQDWIRTRGLHEET